MAVCFLTLASCGEGEALLFPPAAELVVAEVLEPEAAAGVTLLEQGLIRVVDEWGNGVPGVPVDFRVEAGGGTVFPSQRETDGAGVVRIEGWTLGTDVGENVLLVRIEGLDEIRIRVQTRPGSPARIEVEGGAGQEGEVGQPLPILPEVRITDVHGNPIPGVEVRFTPEPPAGRVARSSVLTDEQGRASSGAWELGTEAGPQVLRVSTGGVPAVFLEATAQPGPASSLVGIGGDEQEGGFGEALRRPLEVEVRDSFGNPVPGTTVRFIPAPGSGSASPGQSTTDGGGRANTTWILGPSATEQILRAEIPDVAQVTFTAKGQTTPRREFRIEYEFLSQVSPRHEASLMAAARRWEEVITGNLASVRLNVPAGRCGANSPALSNRRVDDILILVTLRNLGSSTVLGRAGPCAIRWRGGLPALAILELNTTLLDLMDQSGILEDVVVHEIAHALGFGTLWGPQFTNLLRNPSRVFGVGADTHFAGPQAVTRFLGILGGTGGISGQAVPVENEIGGEGTRDAHWRQSVFQNELMTGFISLGGSNPLSTVTVASMADLGYRVDYSRAEPFSAPFAAPFREEGPDQIVELGHGHTHADGYVHLHDNIYQAPVHVINDEGRIVLTLDPDSPQLGPRR